MNHVVLYVEDEENDVLLAEIAFKRAQSDHELMVVGDGLQAIDYLLGVGRFADRDANPFPSLVLLDLKLPHKSGFEVLEWIRQQSEFRSLPVVVYTSSGAKSDRDKARELGASDYCVKPSRISEMTQLAALILKRWIGPENPPP